MLTREQFAKAKYFIYRQGRPLDRRRFAFQFEGASKEPVLQALACYQNDDGGFGHGLEPDLLYPMSTTISAEQAMDLLDELNVTEGEIVDRLETWILSSQQENGMMPPYPVDEVKHYPHGEWWPGSADEERVLSLAAFLGKWGRGTTQFFERVNAYFRQGPIHSLPPDKDHIGFYDYQIYLYLRYAPNMPDRERRLHAIRELFPRFLEEEGSALGNYPLFSSHWSHAADEVSRETLEAEAYRWIAGLQEDGGLKCHYAALPWWRPIATLDGLVTLKRHGFLSADTIHQGNAISFAGQSGQAPLENLIASN